MAMHFNENLDDNGEMHDINVTPFIDVMLVLLIIFMVAAPLATVDVKVNLPASSSQPQPRPEKPIYLSVKADKTMFLGNDPITDEKHDRLAGCADRRQERHHRLLPRG
jgi:biopolymer transport protein ExbD